MTYYSDVSRSLRLWDLFLAMAFCLVLPEAFSQPQEKANDAGEIQRFDSNQLAELETKIQKLYASVAPSVVRIFLGRQESDGGFSGVIVSRSGEVLTCAHYDLPANTKVTVELADGTRVKGTTLGYFKKSSGGFRAHDVGMLRLDEQRNWPAVPLGRAADTKRGDLCLAVGYPMGHKPGQPPLLRLGRLLGFSPADKLRTSCRIEGGDSGGPLFDLNGRVLGVASSIPSAKWANNQYARVEDFITYRKELVAGKEFETEDKKLANARPPTDPWGAFEPAQQLSEAVSSARRSTVEIHDGNQLLALGLIVAGDGWILTKRTELAGHNQLLCWLADGRRVEARVMSGSVEHDLALLKADMTGLPVAEWADAKSLHIGQAIASIGLTPRPLNFGVIGAMHSRNPGTQGVLPIANWESAPPPGTGVRIVALPTRGNKGDGDSSLQLEDVITHFDGQPTPTSEDLTKLRNEREASPAGLAGERVNLTVKRGAQTFEVFVPLSHARPYFFGNVVPVSLRRNGFPNVFSHDGGATSEHCGGPVVNRSGKVIGINIARADMVQTFAIPSDVARELVAELKTKAGKKQAE
jgi:serine protease Do